MASLMNPNPTLLQEILGVLPQVSRHGKEAQQARRKAPNEFVHWSSLPLLVCDHQPGQVALVSAVTAIHLIRIVRYLLRFGAAPGYGNHRKPARLIIGAKY